MSSMSHNPVIQIRGLVKKYGSYVALDDISMDFREGEFFALLGPSGCGKTTLLRSIAGFVEPSSGSISLDGKNLLSMPPNRRPINMMFQSYALFPHMTVEQNICYGLEIARLPRSEIASRTRAIVEATDLVQFAKRVPSELSGGQRQRVALARALVMKPRVLLLDEPLSALDKKLRESMQLELKRLQHDFAITFIVVTHDQEEALVMADRIAVMRGGKVEQIGTPSEVYENPKNRFVAEFIGLTNLIEGVANGTVVNVQDLGTVVAPETAQLNGKVIYSVRPERISVSKDAPPHSVNSFRGKVADIAYHGQDRHIHVEVGGTLKPIVARVSVNDNLGFGLEIDDRVWVSWSRSDARIMAAVAPEREPGGSGE